MEPFSVRSICQGNVYAVYSSLSTVSTRSYLRRLHVTFLMVTNYGPPRQWMVDTENLLSV